MMVIEVHPAASDARSGSKPPKLQSSQASSKQSAAATNQAAGPGQKASELQLLRLVLPLPMASSTVIPTTIPNVTSSNQSSVAWPPIVSQTALEIEVDPEDAPCLALAPEELAFGRAHALCSAA